jgi:hypothetical protein
VLYSTEQVPETMLKYGKRTVIFWNLPGKAEENHDSNFVLHG